MKMSDLSDDALVAALHAICLDAHRLDARLIGHLVEVEERRLHLRVACSSLFDFCVRRLRMSEGAAFRRINAARLTRRFPALLRHIESGRVHLSTLVVLRDHFTESNVEELVDAAAGKTKRGVEELVARLAPRPDVPSTIRKLPAASPLAPAVTAPAVVAANAAAASRALFDDAPRSPQPAAPGTAQAPAPVPAFVPAPAPVPVPAPTPARIEPLSEARYKVQLTVSAELRDKLERAKDLMRHRNPSGDLAVVVEQALDALVEKLEKERLAKTSRPRRPVRATKTGRIPAAVRREVFARDGEQCTFVDDRDNRCPSRAFLELDHIASRALGGPDEAANLRVRCRAHNLLHAEEVFGRKCVERGIHFRQRKCESEPPRADY